MSRKITEVGLQFREKFNYYGKMRKKAKKCEKNEKKMKIFSQNT